jgi:type IV pilus assembly protein PilX
MNPLNNHQKKQSGAVLVISLIMLLLLTIIGLDSMQTSILEEKMAYNMKDRSLAFQAAESALKEGENQVSSFNASNDWHYDTGDSYDVTSPSIWIDPNSEEFSVSEVENAPRYIIYKEDATNYIIYARGTGGAAENAVVLLKSYYKL